MSSLRLTSLLHATCLMFATLAVAAAPKRDSRQVTSASTKNLRILPLGDSITYGWWSTTLNGYRFVLQTSLQNTGYEIDYIGDQQSGNITDNANEGFPGQTISQIQQNGLRPLNGSQPLPNLILLHIGTNDAVNGVSTPAQMITDLKSLMSAIFTRAPNVCPITVCGSPEHETNQGLIDQNRIIMNKNAITQNTINAYKQQISGVITNLNNAGKKVFGVSQSNVDLNNGDGDMIFKDDPTHPSNVGFTKMANNFSGGVQSASQNNWILAPQGVFIPAPHGK